MVIHSLVLPDKKDCSETELSPPLSVEMPHPWSSVKSCHQGKQGSGESILCGAKKKSRCCFYNAYTNPHCDTARSDP